MSKLGDVFRRAASAPFRAMMPKHLGWRIVIIAVPILVIAALLDPVANLLIKLFDLVLRVIEPVLQTPIGRVLVLLFVFALVLLAGSRLLRTRLQTMHHGVLLSRHLDAIAALLRSDPRRSRELFLRVQKRKRVVPSEYTALVQDAHLKLARLALEAGRHGEALAWTARVVEPGLPRELDRSLRQLRLQALRQHGSALPETLLAEATVAVERHPKDYRLLRELRSLHLERGDLLAAAEIQARVVDQAPPAAVAMEKEQLGRDVTAAAELALSKNEIDVAKKLQRTIAKLPGPAGGLLLGAILQHKGDLRAAIKAFGQTRSPEGLDRIAALLTSSPGVMDTRELLECCPMQGTLLLVARELARSGQLDAARRAAQQAAAVLGPTPTVCAVLAEVLQLLGQEQQANLLAEQAVQRLLATGDQGTAIANEGSS
ncbi:MAG: hypothetical protein ABL997_09605 [Planctomycetota bacterium]